VLRERRRDEIADNWIVIHNEHATAWSHVNRLVDIGPACKKHTCDVQASEGQQIFIRGKRIFDGGLIQGGYEVRTASTV
jgi:hypothetical protein